MRPAYDSILAMELSKIIHQVPMLFIFGYQGIICFLSRHLVVYKLLILFMKPVSLQICGILLPKQDCWNLVVEHMLCTEEVKISVPIRVGKDYIMRFGKWLPKYTILNPMDQWHTSGHCPSGSMGTGKFIHCHTFQCFSLYNSLEKWDQMISINKHAKIFLFSSLCSVSPWMTFF